jgi:hypothetical protein
MMSDNNMYDQDIDDKSFKYVMMETSNVYLGARFSLGELLEEDSTPFKLQAIISHYWLKNMDPETTLESQMYYLDKGNFLVKVLKQLKVKVKVSIIIEKKGLGGKVKQQYGEQVWTLDQLLAVDVEEKRRRGVIIREIVISRMALMTFSV